MLTKTAYRIAERAKACGAIIDDRWNVSHRHGADRAWEHKRIIYGILPALAKDQPELKLPTKWKGDRFDVVLRFEREHEGAKWTFRQLFSMLMDGDSDVPLKDQE